MANDDRVFYFPDMVRRKKPEPKSTRQRRKKGTPIGGQKSINGGQDTTGRQGSPVGRSNDNEGMHCDETQHQTQLQEPQFTIQAIVGHQINPEKKSSDHPFDLKVKWEATWEPEENLKLVTLFFHDSRTCC